MRWRWWIKERHMFWWRRPGARGFKVGLNLFDWRIGILIKPGRDGSGRKEHADTIKVQFLIFYYEAVVYHGRVKQHSRLEAPTGFGDIGGDSYEKRQKRLSEPRSYLDIYE